MPDVLPVRLAYEFAERKGLEAEVEQIRMLPLKPGAKYMTGVRRGYMADLLEKHQLLEEFARELWPEGLTPAGHRIIEKHRRRREDYDDLDHEEVIGDSPENEESAFAYEADLQNFLAKNLQILEPGLILYEDERGKGTEYPVADGRIDVLAKDVSGQFVVIELKLSRGRNRALGQILYYMGWIDEHLDGTEPCRGIVVARSVGDDLRLACRRTPGIELYEYSLQVSVRKIGIPAKSKHITNGSK